MAAEQRVVCSRPKRASICILRNSEGHVLLGERLQSKRFGPPGGKIEPGETPKQAMVRELYEETGLTCKASSLMSIFETIDGWEIHAFLVEDWSGSLTNTEPEKCGGWEYFPRSSMQELPMVFSLQHLMSSEML